MALDATYTTPVVGSPSVPRWYEALDRLVEAGTLSRADLADAQHRATQAAILDQEIAGIDIVTGGEMHRRTSNRRAPFHGMLDFFWPRMRAVRGPTRPKPSTAQDPDCLAPGRGLPRPDRRRRGSGAGRRAPHGPPVRPARGQGHG